MFKYNKNLIKKVFFGLGIITFSAFALSLPTVADARVFTYYQPAPFTDTGSSNYSQNPYSQNPVNNPVPYITSITPDKVTAQNQIIKITINGNGFIPSSTVRYDNTPRTVTYISPTRLIVQLNEADIATSGRRYLTVVNDQPGGGFSNPVPFMVNTPATLSTSVNYSNGSYGATALTGYESSSYNSQTNYDTSSTQTSYKTLTSNAIFGTRSFLPNGLFQWIIFVILLLAIFFVWRRFFGGEAKYHATPLKHA